MKRFIAVSLCAAMLFALTGCGSGSESAAPGKPEDPVLTQGDLEDAEQALEILEAMKPEGWDENSYGMYIYDVWDEEFLPDVFPGPVEGIKVYDTTFKDFTHDTLNGDYSVGAIEYESYEDYRQYGVNFFATTDQLAAYIDSAKAGGFSGGERSSPDDEWREFHFYHPDGWFMYIFFNVNNDDGGAFDGCASVCLTDSLYDRPAAIAGVPLPTAGAPIYDYTTSAWYETYVWESGAMESMDIDLNDSFPDPEVMSWWTFFTYYGADAEDAIAYKDQLASLGWTVDHAQDDSYDPAEGDYRSALHKDDVYAVVNCYNNTELEVGFSDMIENLSY